MLILQRKAGESLVIGEDITIRVVSVDGMRVRLAISAPEDGPILRSELVIATAANRESAMEEIPSAELLDLLGGVLDHKQGLFPYLATIHVHLLHYIYILSFPNNGFLELHHCQYAIITQNPILLVTVFFCI